MQRTLANYRNALIVTAAGVLLAACGSSGASPTPASPSSAAASAPASAAASAPASAAASAPAASPGSITIGLALSTLNNPYFITMENAAKQEAAAKGVTLIVADGQNDQAKETAAIEDFIAKKVDAILLNPVDSNGAVPVVKEANVANIPVIVVDRNVGTGAQIAAFIASDNVEAGKLASTALFVALHGSGKVVLLSGVPGNGATNDRTQGFQEALASYPGISVVASQTAQFDRATALTVMENILQAHPDVQGVFAENDEMALGAIQAIKGLSKGAKVLVSSIDGTADGMTAVQAGLLLETVAQQPALMAKNGLDDLVTLIEGGSVPTGFQATPLIEVTQANVSQYK